MPYMVLATLKGNINTAPINLNINSIENPIILKGNRISHTSGNSTSMSKASGQQIINKKHHNRNPIKVISLSLP